MTELRPQEARHNYTGQKLRVSTKRQLVENTAQDSIINQSNEITTKDLLSARMN